MLLTCFHEEDLSSLLELLEYKYLILLVGVTGFEPATPSSRTGVIARVEGL